MYIDVKFITQPNIVLVGLDWIGFVTVQIHSYQILFLCGLFPFGLPLKLLKRFCWGRFPHPYKRWFVLLSNQCGTSQSTSLWGLASSLALFPSSNRCGTAPKSTLLWGPASLLAHCLVSTPLRGIARRLAHRPVSGSDTICNVQDSPLANIVLFGLFPFRLLLKSLKHVCWGKVSTPL